MIRIAIPDDAEAIERVKVLAWQSAYQKFLNEDFLLNLSHEDYIENRRKILAYNRDSMTIVEEYEQEVVAFCVFGKPRFSTEHSCSELWALNVTPKFWRRGIARNLIDKTSEIVRAKDFRKIELWCIHKNEPAQRAYEACGFVNTNNYRTTNKSSKIPLTKVKYEKLL